MAGAHVRTESEVRWLFSSGAAATVVVAIVLATAGLTFARIDLALLALPFAVGAAWAWDRRPAAEERSTLEVRLDALFEQMRDLNASIRWMREPADHSAARARD